MVEGDGDGEVGGVVTLRETEGEGDGDEGVVSGYELRHPYPLVNMSRDLHTRRSHGTASQLVVHEALTQVLHAGPVSYSLPAVAVTAVFVDGHIRSRKRVPSQ